ncbi:uncharacterized protein KY384_000811 [Bacidia gigantensis]|uniref:uncharacterized protein n=1 Tax=Bacidia gigantensis TaxID=2732470 RepID=UPI001D0473B0|nr:uncharacterized protein KY384_000811 [Bacidia gigantensis]KAG8526049.1 hypothetical protein KY384_000811 [Bacidia gigantensis]
MELIMVVLGRWRYRFGVKKMKIGDMFPRWRTQLKDLESKEMEICDKWRAELGELEEKQLALSEPWRYNLDTSTMESIENENVRGHSNCGEGCDDRLKCFVHNVARINIQHYHQMIEEWEDKLSQEGLTLAAARLVRGPLEPFTIIAEGIDDLKTRRDMMREKLAEDYNEKFVPPCSFRSLKDGRFSIASDSTSLRSFGGILSKIRFIEEEGS